MFLAVISIFSLAAGLCLANARPIDQVLLAHQKIAATDTSAFQNSLQEFSYQITVARSILNSSSVCPIAKELPELQKQHESFEEITKEWSRHTSLMKSCKSSNNVFNKNTRLLQLEVAQLGNELSTAIDSKPADADTACSENPNLVLLSLNLGNFAKRLSSYDAFLSSASQNGLCVPTAMVSTSVIVQTDATTGTGSTTVPTQPTDAILIGIPFPEITTIPPSVTVESRSASTISAISKPTQNFPLIVDHTTPNTIRSISTTREISTSIGILAQELVLNTVAVPPSTSLTAALAAPGSKTVPSYVFNKNARDNVAVYYGQTELTSSTSLADQCADPNVDIVILSFLNTFNSAGGFPGINFGAACIGQTAEQQLKAPGLLTCPSLAEGITSCQNMGKKVLLSLGGYGAQSTFASDSAGEAFAQTIWDLFGGGQNYSNDLRPFGTVKLDGFDIDNESHSQVGYVAFATKLRSLYDSDPSKTYYLSAAPQCVYPDASIPMDTMALADFVWIQFYNNDCAISASPDTFMASLKQWSDALAAQNNATKVFVGVLGWSGGGTGYVDHDALKDTMQAVKTTELANLGGIMLWDGPMARANLGATGAASGATYLQAAKDGLIGV